MHWSTREVESWPLSEPYGAEFRARDHHGRADTLKDGTGGDSGLRPHELLEASLATCMTITARMAADDLGISADGIRVLVELERREKTSVFHYRLELPADLGGSQVDAIRSRIERSPVRRTLSADVVFQAGAWAVP